MKAFLVGIVLIAVISVGAFFTLENLGFSQAKVSASESNVRIGDAGSDGE